MKNYTQHLVNTPQTLKADPRQAKNSAGGYVFKLDQWERLDRWLILGAEGGTYYASEQKLTLANAQAVRNCLSSDPDKTVSRIVEISVTGRAPKNDPAIFALALAASHDSPLARAAACAAVRQVCRTGTHLFQFAASVAALRGWGAGLRKAVASWYDELADRDLCYQLVKYQQRNGWSHRDLLRLSHPKPGTPKRSSIYKYVVKGNVENAHPYLEAFERLKVASKREAMSLIEEYHFTHEMIPTQLKNDADVWMALLEKMPVGAMVRNLGKLTQVGAVAPLSRGTKMVCDRLANQLAISKSRIHPISILSAARVYARGWGLRGSLTWSPVEAVSSALDAAFYSAFGNVTASGKKTLVALDVSGSMSLGEIAGVPGLTPRVASAAMAMVTMRTEPEWYCVGFTGQLTPLDIRPEMTLNHVIDRISDLPFGITDCAQPMIWAKQKKIPVEAFQIWTDNCTWCGDIHPHQALREFRTSLGSASLAVVGCTSTGFTIADPSDAGMLDVVGFDSATPNLLASFAKGWQ